VLSERFSNDGKSVLPLNDVQIKAIDEFRKNCGTNYHFENVNCLVCDSDNFESLAEKDRYGLPMSVVICRQCGLVQTNPRMNKDSYARFFNDQYLRIFHAREEISEKFFDDEYNHGRVIYEFISDVTKSPMKNKFIVEIGTGAGGILQYFKDMGNEVFGVDIGKDYIELGRRHGLDLEVGTVEKLAEIKKIPDLIIYAGVMGNLLNPVKELEILRTSLNPESLLYLEVKSISNLEKTFKQDFLKFLHGANTYHYTLNSLNNCAKKAGFELVHGNARTNALFRIGKVDNNYRNDYESTLKFLQNLEKMRLNPLNSQKIKSKIFSLGKKAGVFK